MDRVDASTARRTFAQLYNRVAYGGERIVVENHGKGLVALVPIADVAGSLEGSSQQAPGLETCLDVLRRERRKLEAAGVRRVAVFGSVARGTARPDSDLDVLIEIDDGVKFDLIALAGLRDRLVERFGREVDIMTRRSLQPGRHDAIIRDAIYAF